MTFKVKSGFNVGSTPVVDQNSYFQQTESAATVPPSLYLDFTSKALDRRIQFSRGSNGTFVSANGLIQNAASNVARFDHNAVTRECKGLLMEEQKTNLLLWSANTRGGGWFVDQAYLDSTTVPAPDGSLTASKLTEGTSSVNYRIMRYDPAMAANTQYTFSIFAKAAEQTQINVGFYDNSGGLYSYVNCDLANGVVLTAAEVFSNQTPYGTLTSSMVPYSNNWYRIIMSFTTGANTACSIRAGLNTFASPGGNVNGVYVWGGQLEDRFTATSFIYTTTSQVTRLIDDAQINGANFTNFFNREEGTVITESEVNSVMTGSQGVINANRYPFLWTASKWGGSNTTAITWYGSVVELSINGNYNNQGGVSPGPSKYAVAVANSSGQTTTCLNGGAVQNRVGTGFGKDVDYLGIGSANGSGVVSFNGTIKNFTFYPKQLDANTIINLTTI